MKKLVIELMNHGYSQDQAQTFILKCYDEFIDQIENINETLDGKELKAKYAASDNETVGN